MGIKTEKIKFVKPKSSETWLDVQLSALAISYGMMTGSHADKIMDDFIKWAKEKKES